jgi:hypothetical protein
VKKFEDEFDDFVGDKTAGPAHLARAQFLDRVHNDLNPTMVNVLKKLILIQLGSGLLTLLFCPQLGVGFTSNMGLMSILMSYGETYCMAGCGALFLGIGSLIAALLLRPEEVRVLRQTQLMQFPILSFLALSVFICFGAPVITVLGLAWLAGSVIGAIATFNVARVVRFN